MRVRVRAHARGRPALREGGQPQSQSLPWAVARRCATGPAPAPEVVGRARRRAGLRALAVAAAVWKSLLVAALVAVAAVVQ